MGQSPSIFGSLALERTESSFSLGGINFITRITKFTNSIAVNNIKTISFRHIYFQLNLNSFN